MSESINLTSKMKSYAMMASEAAQAMPANRSDIQPIYKESEKLFLLFMKNHQDGIPFGRMEIGRFLDIGVELLAWHDTMTLLNKAGIKTG